MKADVSSLIKISHTILLAAIVTFVALVSVDLWNFNDPHSTMELRSGVMSRGEDSEVYFRLLNTGAGEMTYTFTLILHCERETTASTWSVAVQPGCDFEYILHTNTIDGLSKVNIKVHREGESDPIRDIVYLLDQSIDRNEVSAQA